ncbi:SRPBCC family protein [Ancylobacter oerskovii]|uniref:SRPBCC family protein n=1 Tax=Ancylobacter oerskovii TaxID=459519 RepID=A0ABW4YUR2_9HYPH|nr:SRPBCC family protein [Ancylobacter oerskovii]MBS7544653.1 SRPBCC family protein [Ancylobacter oerskovii]
MLRRMMLAVALVLAGLAPLAAHGPTPQRAEERVTIAASPDKVWALLASFGAIGDWHPLVKKVSATGGNAAGAERVLTLEKGEITEGLDEIDPAERRLSYRLGKENAEAFPVSFYTAAIEVKPSGGGSEVVWDARFYRADTTNEPPEGRDDAAAIAAMTDFIKQGLEGLRSKAGGQ